MPRRNDEEWSKLLEGLAPEESTPTEKNATDPFPDPKPDKLGLSESARKILDASRKARAMDEALELGQSIFVRSPDFLQRRFVDLILIMDSITAKHPRARKKIIGRVIDGCLGAAAEWVRERKKGAT